MCNHSSKLKPCNTNRTPPIITIADSGSSGHYLRADCKLKSNIEHDIQQVKIPDGTIMTSRRSVELEIPGVSSKTKTAHVFDSIASTSLLSIGKLCDDGCIATFTKEDLKITNNKKQYWRESVMFQECGR